MFCLMYGDFVWRGELDAFNKREQYKWHTAKCRVTFNTRGYHKKNQKKYFPISHATETLQQQQQTNKQKAKHYVRGQESTGFNQMMMMMMMIMMMMIRCCGVQSIAQNLFYSYLLYCAVIIAWKISLFKTLFLLFKYVTSETKEFFVTRQCAPRWHINISR